VARSRTGSVYVRGIPDYVRDQFKCYCNRRRKSMTEVITQFMRDCVDKDNELKLSAMEKRERIRNAKANHLRD
jgi:adenylate cyclase